MSNHEDEKPDSSKVIGQGYGYVEVHKADVGPATSPELSGVSTEWRRVRIERDGEGRPYGALHTDRGLERVPVGRLSPRKPGSCR